MIVLYNPRSNASGKRILPMSLLALGALLEGGRDYVIVDGNLEAEPLARLDQRFLPLLYNRRHLGVATFLVALSHALAVLDWHFSFSPTPALVAPEVLATAEKLALEPIEADGDHPTVHAFRYRAAPGRYLYVQVEKGLKAWGGYELGRRWDTTLQVPPLPQEVRILQSGALLSLRGERRLALYSRDVPAIRYEIGRVLPERLALLATQAGGNFATPEFHAWSFSADDLTELRSSVETVAAAAPGRVCRSARTSTSTAVAASDCSPRSAPARRWCACPRRARPGIFRRCSAMACHALRRYRRLNRPRIFTARRFP